MLGGALGGGGLAIASEWRREGAVVGQGGGRRCGEVVLRHGKAGNSPWATVCGGMKMAAELPDANSVEWWGSVIELLPSCSGVAGACRHCGPAERPQQWVGHGRRAPGSAGARA
jgi:hypothetical protein